MKIRLKHLFLALVALMCLVLLSSCGSAPQPKQSVASMEDIGIKTQPKTAYILGEPFDVSAGVLNLFYDDGTTKELPFTVFVPTVAISGALIVTPSAVKGSSLVVPSS